MNVDTTWFGPSSLVVHGNTASAEGAPVDRDHEVPVAVASNSNAAGGVSTTPASTPSADAGPTSRDEIDRARRAVPRGLLPERRRPDGTNRG